MWGASNEFMEQKGYLVTSVFLNLFFLYLSYLRFQHFFAVHTDDLRVVKSETDLESRFWNEQVTWNGNLHY